MSRKVLVLVEGQTEERFIKDVLVPWAWAKDLTIIPTILTTKWVKDGPNFKGGIRRFAKLEGDMRRLFRSHGGALITMMFDYYAFPMDSPGMRNRPNGNAEQRVAHVEAALAQHFKATVPFLPFLMLHEFETLLFSDVTVLPATMTRRETQDRLEEILATCGEPEAINETPDGAPSKRIVNIYKDYRKPLHGPLAAGRIGIEAMRGACPHFNTWLNALEYFGEHGTLH